MTDQPVDWPPTARIEAMRLRARLYQLVRGFFAERGVLEVETPMLSAAGNTDANIEGFNTDFHGPTAAGARQRWLRTSPEYPLKRLVAAGIGDCYEMGRVFRNGEAGGRHNPEFTMLEWYRVGWDHRRLAEEAADLVQAALGLVGRRTAVRRATFRELYRKKLGIDPFTATLEELRAPLAVYEIDAEGLDRDDWLDLLMTHLIQPSLSTGRILVLSDYPASQCALAKIRDGDPPVAERFELFVGPLELANGYHELTDATEQRQRFAKDLQRRKARGAARPPVDEVMLAALEHGLPPCAGVALGVERLLMAMLGSERIADVLAFPFERA